ncbi:MAG: hypothetical protein IPP51_13050 [Bacteroidetes bacterium]|nr:hypothetical protein [Bacteroidota bacterium]
MRLSQFRLLFITCFLLCRSAGIALAGNFGIQAAFVHTSTTQQPTEVASNTLRVKNFTNSTVRFKVNFSLPGGWSFLGIAEKSIELAAGDSVFIPARLIMDKSSKGGTSYIVTAWLASDKGVQFSSQNWYVTVPIKSSWTGQLPTKQMYFITGVDSSGFRMLFKNQGNADEQLRITMVPDHRLEVLRSSDGGAALLTFTLNLPVGTDTVLTFPVVKRSDRKNTGRKDADLHAPPSKESYSIQITAKSLNTAASWSGTMQFIKLGNIAHLNEFGHSAAPLVLEANIYDVLSNGTSMSLDAYGSLNMRNEGLLNYRFQTVFVSNFLEQNSFLGNNHYVGYFNNRMSLEVGEINGWGRSLISGRGIKGSYTIGRNTVGGIYTRGPGFFKPHSSEGMGFFHNYRTKSLSWSNYLSTQSNTQLHLFNTLVNTAIVYRINPRHQILLGGGVSNEQFKFGSTNTAAPGYGFDATYSGSFRKINVSGSVANGTGNYSLSRGVFMISG